ncbi:MAG TPA: PH domain-containing protein [Flavobacterium sp.]|jgi:putative membrane protein
MAPDFSQPQRQSPIGILVLFFYALQQYARALWPLIVFSIFKFQEINSAYWLVGICGILILIGVVSYLRYLNFTFFLDVNNNEFVITEGILNKSRITIQLNKIQQVNVDQSLIQKIVGVFALSVDTAGSQKKEVNIKAISHHLALALKTQLLDNEVKNQEDPTVSGTIESPVTAEEPFVKISFFSLIKIGITSNYVRSFLVLFAFLISESGNNGIYSLIIRIFYGKTVQQEQIDTYITKNNVTLQLVAIVILVLFAVVIMFNLVKTLFKYFDFKIARQKGSLLLSFGLLNTRSTIIKPEKVQVIAISQNYFQKKMDVLVLKIKQATSGESEEQKSAIEIPGCNAVEKDQILALLFQQVPKKGVMLQPNFRKLGFSIFLGIILPLILYFVIISYINPEIVVFHPFVPFYVIIVAVVLFLRFRKYRLFIHDNFIIKQSGFWDISNQIIEPKKIQAITTSQLFWHKKVNIGSLTLHTAGGTIHFQLGQFDVIKQYVNLWLYEMERSDSNWM